MAAAKIGIVTVSDRASRGLYEDLGGPAIAGYLAGMLTSPWQALARVIPDEPRGIEDTLIALADAERCAPILTAGGTGPAPRDVTPEATAAVCRKMLPGLGELMRTKSLEQVPAAILSRQTAGIRGRRSSSICRGGRPRSTTVLARCFPLSLIAWI